MHTDGQKLRCGYTTGSCAALATQAAVKLLLTGVAPERVHIVTPAGIAVEVDVLEPHCFELDGVSYAECAVQKDAGDDVDVTDGALVYAQVSRTDEAGVHIDGGEGVGRVTLPGLEQPVGNAAINSGPRAMIEGEAVRAAADHGYQGGLDVLISIPEGVELAEKTFNSHLGITGGISVLGTTGIVEPKSLKALCDSLEVEIRQHAAMGCKRLVLAPGNYGKTFVESIPELSVVPQVSCANFIGRALDFCAQYGFEEVLFAGHIGKMVKVAGSIMDTHSRVADCRAEIFCAHAAIHGASQELCQEIMTCPTTDAVLDILKTADLYDQVIASIGAAIVDRMDRRVAGAYRLEVIVFSNAHGELFRSAGATEMIGKWTIEEGADHE